MIVFDKVRIAYKDRPVLNDVTLKIEDGEFFVLIGSSGCGKTTLLKSINKLLPLKSGSLSINGIPVKDVTVQDLPKMVGYVVQSGGLFPHMTVEENIALTMQIARMSKGEIQERVDQMLRMVNLDPDIYRNQYPSQLSGGQQQRVGIARAFAADPPIVLMDEPFSALDPVTRSELQNEIHYLHAKDKKTVVFVTHDMDEAIRLADRIVIMDQGHIIQNASPDDVLTHPANEFVANLIGPERLRQAKVNHLTAAEIMRPNPIKIHAQQNLGDALNQMHQYHVDSLMVVDDEDHLTGILDLKTLRNQQQPQLIIDDMKHAVPVKIKEDERLQMITEPLLERNWEYVPVVDEQNHLKGIITRSALVDVIYDAVWGTTENPHPAKDQAKDLKEAGEQ